MKWKNLSEGRDHHHHQDVFFLPVTSILPDWLVLYNRSKPMGPSRNRYQGGKEGSPYQKPLPRALAARSTVEVKWKERLAPNLLSKYLTVNRF